MGYRGVLGGLVLLVSILVARPAAGQSDEELQAARKLFLEAVRDLDAGRYDACLKKFKRVQTVKDTVNVRYNLAQCLEGLGRVTSAHAMFQAAIALAAGDDRHVEATNESLRRASLLIRRIPHLTVELQPVVGAEVRVDDASWSAPGRTMAVDPGRHVVTVTLAGRERFRETVLLGEGQHATVSVPPEALAPDPEPEVIAVPKTEPTTMPPKKAPSRSKTPWVLTTAAGGVLVATSGVLFALWGGELAELQRMCPHNRCAVDDASEVNSVRDRMRVYGTTGLWVGIGGVLATGLGTFMLVRPDGDDRPGVRVLPSMGQHGGSVMVTGTF